MKKLEIVIERDGRFYVAKVKGLKGCATQGKSLNELMDRVKEAIKICLESENIKF